MGMPTTNKEPMRFTDAEMHIIRCAVADFSATNRGSLNVELLLKKLQSGAEDCYYCGGEGQIKWESAARLGYRKCGNCQGTGKVFPNE